MRFSTIFATLAAVGLSTAVPTAPADAISARPQGNATYVVTALQMYVFDQREKPRFQGSFHFSIESPRPAQVNGDGFCSFDLPGDKLQDIYWLTCTSAESIYFQFKETKDKEAWNFIPSHFWGGRFIDYAVWKIPKTLFKVVDDTPKWHRIEYTGPSNFNISKDFNPDPIPNAKGIAGGLIGFGSLLPDDKDED